MDPNYSFPPVTPSAGIQPYSATASPEGNTPYSTTSAPANNYPYVNFDNSTGEYSFPGATIFREREMVILKRPVQTAGLQNIPSSIQGGQPPWYQLQGDGVQARSQPNPQPSKTTFEHPIKMGMPATNAHSLFLGNHVGRSPSFSSQASLTHQSQSSSYHGTPSCQYSTGSTYIGEGHNLANVGGMADNKYLSGQLLSLKDVQPEIHQQALDQANPASAKQTMLPPRCSALTEVSQPCSVRSNQEPTISSASTQAPNQIDVQKVQDTLLEIVQDTATNIKERAGIELQKQIKDGISVLSTAMSGNILPDLQEKVDQELDKAFNTAHEKSSSGLKKHIDDVFMAEVKKNNYQFRISDARKLESITE